MKLFRPRGRSWPAAAGAELRPADHRQGRV